MGRPGRKPLPAAVHVLRGNRSKLTAEELEERRRSEIRPNPISPRRPRDLSRDEAECWDAHAPELDRLGLLTVLDGVSFRMLVCQPYAIAREARRLMGPRRADGEPDGRRRRFELVVVDDRGALRRHPAFMIWKQAIDQYRTGCTEFGLTPSSRVGLRPGAPIGVVPDEDDDAAFFGV